MPIRSANPVGSRKEIDDLGLNPNEWGSCSEMEQGKNLGCGRWGICPWRGPRPFRRGFQIIKPTGNGIVSRNGRADCFAALGIKEGIELNGGSFRFIANEGEDIELSGVRSRARDPLKPLEKTSEWETWTEKVEPFPLASSRPDLFHARALVEERKKVEARKLDERESKMLGLHQTMTGFEVEAASGRADDTPGAGGQRGGGPGKK